MFKLDVLLTFCQPASVSAVSSYIANVFFTHDSRYCCSAS